MLNLAVQWEYLEKSPASGQEMFTEPPQRERYLSKVELPRFLNALEGDGEEDRLSVAAIRLLLATGCRRSEVLSLKWNEVRLGEERIFLSDTKNGRSRTVHLNANAQEVLVELLGRRDQEARTRESEFVFPSRLGTRKGHIYDLRKPFEKACQRAGVENFRIHDLRHTFASMAVRGGLASSMCRSCSDTRTSP